MNMETHHGTKNANDANSKTSTESNNGSPSITPEPYFREIPSTGNIIISPPSKSPKRLKKPTKSFKKYVSSPKKSPPQRLTTPPIDSSDSSQGEAPEMNDSASASITGRNHFVWKRRNGMGMLSSKNSWERRRLALQGTKLMYFADGSDSCSSEEESTSRIETETDAAQQVNHNNTKKISESIDWLWDHAAAAAQRPLNAIVGSNNTEFDPSVPRGCIDMAKEHATAAVSTACSGAPTPFGIVVKSTNEYTSKTKTKWNFCFDTHEDQVAWLCALSNVVVRNSIEEHVKSHALNGETTKVTFDCLDPTFCALERRMPDQEIEVEFGDDGRDDAQSMLQTTRSLEQDIHESAGPPSTTSVSSSMPPPAETGEKFVLTGTNLLTIISMFNLISLMTYWGIISTVYEFFSLLVLLNASTWWCLGSIKEPPPSQPLPIPKPASSRHKLSLRRQANHSESSIPTKQSLSRSIVPSTSRQPPAKGCSVPVAGSSTVLLRKENDENTNNNGVRFPGWRKINGHDFRVRPIGYLEHKKKSPSLDTLYECSAVDIFESHERVMDIATRVQLPKLSFDTVHEKDKTWHCPNVFILSISIPTESPSLYHSTDDGHGFSIILYLTLKQETYQMLQTITDPDFDAKTHKWPGGIDQAQKVNGIKLFDEWCRRSPTDPTFQARFKIVPDALNLKEIGLPSYITKYKDKPVLIKRAGVTGTLYTHDKLDEQSQSVMEFNFNLHAFPYLAKQAFCYMKDAYFKKVLCNLGFVIEGRDDEELPEVIVGAFQLCYPDPAHAVQAEDFFRGTCEVSSSQ